MIKKVLMCLVLLVQLIGLNVSVVHAEGPPTDTHGYEMYIEHAGDGTHADDPLDIYEPEPPDGGGGGSGV